MKNRFEGMEGFFKGDDPQWSRSTKRDLIMVARKVHNGFYAPDAGGKTPLEMVGEVYTECYSESKKDHRGVKGPTPEELNSAFTFIFFAINQVSEYQDYKNPQSPLLLLEALESKKRDAYAVREYKPEDIVNNARDYLVHTRPGRHMGEKSALTKFSMALSPFFGFISALESEFVTDKYTLEYDKMKKTGRFGGGSKEAELKIMADCACDDLELRFFGDRGLAERVSIGMFKEYMKVYKSARMLGEIPTEAPSPKVLRKAFDNIDKIIGWREEVGYGHAMKKWSSVKVRYGDTLEKKSVFEVVAGAGVLLGGSSYSNEFAGLREGLLETMNFMNQYVSAAKEAAKKHK